MNTLARACLALGLALALWLPPGAAQATDIVDTAYVEQAIARGAIVWDARDAEAYRRGHLPGAVNIGDVGRVLRDANREDWLPTTEIAALLGKAGIDPMAREVIVYSHKGDNGAYFGLSTLRHFGAPQVRAYHGGIDDWVAAGKPVETAVATRAPVNLVLTPQAGVVLWNDDMMQRVREGRSQILDVRTPREFSGDDIRAIRGGHIPGAMSIPYEQNWVDPDAAGKLARRETRSRDGMSLKPREELSRLYAGLDRSREVVVYCQSGVRAAQTASVLRDLGFGDVKVYEPSWLGYAGVLGAPAQRETFLNVGALNGRLAVLQRRIEDLEAELAKARAGR
jgi:thiosulfate/3-mercaptopyruvate sulfurtransferase